MKIILFKRDFLFIVVQVSMFWNFCKGYIQLCQDSNIGSPNGTTVTAEIGKPASVLFCVTSDRTLYEHALVGHPSHRYGKWIRIKEKEEKVVSKFNITNKINITIDKVQSNDLNVSFSVKVHTKLNNGRPDYNDFLILTFILQKQSRLEMCQNNMKGSGNGTTVRAEIGGSASVSFCVISDTTLYNHVFISQPYHRSGWSPGSEKGVDVQFVSEDNSHTVNITIQDITDTDINTAFIVKVCTVRHFENSQTNKEFIILTFVLQETSLTTVATISTMETTFTERSAVAVTDIEMTSPMKQDTESAPDTTQTDGISPTAVAPTSVCQPQAMLECPENWLPVKDTCLRMIPREHFCYLYGAELPEETLASCLTSCLTYLLQNTTSKVILLKGHKYFDVRANSTTVRGQNYQKVCITAPPKITQFSLETTDNHSKRQTLRRDLMNEELPYIILEPTENFLNFTCAANGIPEPDVEICRDNVSLRQSPGRVTFVINQVKCQDSGLYTCHARNSLATTHIQKQIEVKRLDRIESFIVGDQRHNIYSGYSVEMRCTTTKCPSPNTLTILDDKTNVKKRTALNSYLVHEIIKVECSDMGTYTCKAETQDAQILEKKADMKVDRCPVQLCRGEDKSKVISADIGQTLNFSVCVMSSYYQPTWKNIYQYKNISATFTSRQPGNLYYTTNILFYNIEERDLGTKIIRIGNRYGHLDYNITISFDSPEVHDGQGKSVTGDETQSLVIILLLVLLVIVLFVIVGVILYRMRGTLLSRLRERNTGDTRANNDTGQAEYANLRELDSVSAPAPERRDEGEQETSVTNDGGQELLLQDSSNKDSGRVISEQGLVYVTVAQAANVSKKKKKPSRSKPKRTRKEPVEPVEYTTLDFEKTGKIVITEEEDGKKDDGGNQENGSVDQQEETGEKKEKSDDKKE